MEKFDGLIERMPHGADHLARLFRDSDRWVELEEWFTGYCTSEWSCIDWTTGSLARMFPSQNRPETVSEFVASYLEDTATPPVAIGATFAQRLVAWDPTRARELLRIAARDSRSAQARRWIALAGLNAGLDRGWATAVLQEFEENALTLAHLQASKFKPIKVVADFSGD